jgi:hypothetical protein
MEEKPDEAAVNHRPGGHAVGELLGEPGTTDHAPKRGDLRRPDLGADPALNYRDADRTTVIQHSRSADVPTRLRRARHTFGCSLPMAAS